jgi:hypothetical protein
MAFAAVVKQTTVFGNKRIVMGTYTNSSSTGGDITTGLSLVEAIFLQPVDSSVIANAAVINETLPLANDGGVVTIVTTNNENGIWMAYGE